MEHLYVMQSSDGLIKVGRSECPSQRRRQLEVVRKVSIRLIASIRNRGSLEGRVCRAAANHLAFGEWFHDTPALREILCAEIGRPLPFVDDVPHTKKSNEQAIESRAGIEKICAASVARILSAPVKRRRRIAA